MHASSSPNPNPGLSRRRGVHDGGGVCTILEGEEALALGMAGGHLGGLADFLSLEKTREQEREVLRF